MISKCRRVTEDLNKHPIVVNTTPLINKKSKIFTIGSCFALEIAQYLIGKNYNVFNSELDKFVDHNFIWYNTYSILYEFEKAVGSFKQEDNDIWKAQDGRYQDPYRRCVFSKTKKNLLSTINDSDKKIKHYIHNADVLIMTLGLVEVWVKKDNNRVICSTPGYPKGKGAGKDKCFFKVSSYEDNLENIKKSMDLLRTINPNCNIIITTSPVALASTFREIDHLVANTESKSILRAVCGQIEREYKNVTYYPSYEMAMHFNKSDVFKADGRHVKSEFVSIIMQHFENNFMQR